MKPVTEPILCAAASAFDFGGPMVCDPHHYGEGHINDTFVVWRANHTKRFILQRINTDTFTDPAGLMENICGVTQHLRAKIQAEGGDPGRECLNVIPTLSGAAYYIDSEGNAWRAYDFVENTVCLQQVGCEADFRTVAETLGKFQNQLADYPASTLHETIARFHDTPNRYANFEKALAADALGRAKTIAPEIAFIHAREKDCHVLLDQLAAGEIPLRVTHNDTKINNVLLDEATGKGICLPARTTTSTAPAPSSHWCDRWKRFSIRCWKSSARTITDFAISSIRIQQEAWTLSFSGGVHASFYSLSLHPHQIVL